jgi:hypothetical protein
MMVSGGGGGIRGGGRGGWPAMVELVPGIQRGSKEDF